MKRKTFERARILSVILGFLYLGSFVWFSDYYITAPSYLLIFSASTILALIISPLISETLLKFLIIRVIAVLLIIIGGLNNIYMMINTLLTSQYVDDIVAGIIQQMIVLSVLTIMLRRTINPNLSDTTSTD